MKKLNQRGGGEIAVFFLIAIAIFGAWFLTDITTFTKVGDWAVRCNKDNGKVQIQQAGLNPDYECYRNGKIIDHEN